MKDKIIKYMLTKYDPHTIILYGSYANGTNNLNSDFDAVIITDKQFSAHDATEIDGVLLDVFIYNTSSFGNEINFNEYVQIHDGCIVLDKYETGKYLKENVCKLIKETPKKYNEEKLQQIKWCEKMLSRIERNDAEGYFRYHWLLVDSLEIYFIICNEYYYGPKKALIKLKAEDSKGFSLYNNTLSNFGIEPLTLWINYIKDLFYNSIS